MFFNETFQKMRFKEKKNITQKSKSFNFIKKLTSKFDIEKKTKFKKKLTPLDSSKNLASINGHISFAKFSNKKNSLINIFENKNKFLPLAETKNESINPLNSENPQSIGQMNRRNIQKQNHSNNTNKIGIIKKWKKGNLDSSISNSFFISDSSKAPKSFNQNM